MTVETANRVRKLCLAIRTRTDNYGVDMRHWLHDLENLAESGWARDALPILQLKNDANELRKLAHAIESIRIELIKPEKPNAS